MVENKTDLVEKEIKALMDAFGADGTYLTEFSLSGTSLDKYSTDETAQARGLVSMIEDIESMEMDRVFFICFNHGIFGALKSHGVYRKIWNILRGY